MEDDVELGVQTAIEQYGGAVKKICSKILMGYPSQDIEETVADCYVAFWRGIHHFDVTRNSSLKSYLYGIARKMAMNKRRKLVNTPKMDFDEEVVLRMEDKRAEREFDSYLDMKVLDDLINHMDAQNREIFICRYYAEMPIKDIADKLNMTEKAVEGRLARGKKTLQRQLSANGICVG